MRSSDLSFGTQFSPLLWEWVSGACPLPRTSPHSSHRPSPIHSLNKCCLVSVLGQMMNMGRQAGRWTGCWYNNADEGWKAAEIQSAPLALMQWCADDNGCESLVTPVLLLQLGEAARRGLASLHSSSWGGIFQGADKSRMLRDGCVHHCSGC